MSPIFQNNSGLVKLFDGIVLRRDNIHTWAIELLVVVELKARTLYAEEVRHLQRGEDVPLSRVTNAITRFLKPELIGPLVGLRYGYRNVLVEIRKFRIIESTSLNEKVDSGVRRRGF